MGELRDQTAYCPRTESHAVGWLEVFAVVTFRDAEFDVRIDGEDLPVETCAALRAISDLVEPKGR